MKVVKWIAIVIVALIALFVVIGLLLPSEFYVQRKIIIDAPPEKIHVLVGDLARWPEWEPWLRGRSDDRDHHRGRVDGRGSLANLDG